MYAALQEAEKALDYNEVPIGAIVVKDEKMIGKGFNQVEKLKDATAHAEMIALTAAANHLNNWRLEDCSIYVTLEPCIMCTGAYWHPGSAIYTLQLLIQSLVLAAVYITLPRMLNLTIS